MSSGVERELNAEGDVPRGTSPSVKTSHQPKRHAVSAQPLFCGAASFDEVIRDGVNDHVHIGHAALGAQMRGVCP